MRTVFLLCEYPTLNGGEQSMLATLGGIASQGFQPAVIAPPVGPLAVTLAARGIEVIPFERPEPTGRSRPLATLREELAALLRHRRPALLHANSLSMGRLAGPVVASLGLPGIAHLRDIIKLSSQAIADLNCQTRLLAVSHAVREFHVARGMNPDKVHVLYNGVDLDLFQPRPRTGALHRELGLPADAQLIGTIGQIGLRKGLDVLVRAAEIAAGQCPEAHWLVIGERSSDKDESRQFEADLHAARSGALAGRLHFLGRRSDVPQVLGELTMLIHPARQEPLGRVLLEAAASGTAVVATDVGGTREIFPPESGSARLVAAGDPEALAAAMVELASNANLRTQLSLAARRRAENCFDIRQAAANLARHYEELPK